MSQKNEPSHDAIEKLAHSLFEKEGRPEGRSLDFWLKAKAILEKQEAEKAQGKIIRKRTNKQ